MGYEDPFLAEAQRRGLMTAAQAADCTRIEDTLAEIDVDMSIDEIAARKGFVTAEQGAEIRRALARQRIGRYEVLGRLGDGAAGVVWKALDTKLDRVVALKVLSQNAQAVPEFRERFLREARIAVTLNHVNIVRGLDYGETAGYHFFAMEFVEGENGEALLARKGRIPERDAVAMALDVVRALQYVQKFHIVHRDIKPGNLMCTPTGHVKLCDLGLAKPMLAEAELIAGDGSTAGTPYYMSPEQIDDPDKIDWKSDVYSLGATLYHLLTGVPVFRADGRSAILQKHLHEPPANPREHALDLTDSVAAVVMRMLQKDPNARYESLDDVASDLESVLAGRTPLHVAPSVPPEEATAERHARMASARRDAEARRARSKAWWGIAATMAFVVLGGSTLWFATHGDDAKKPPPPPLPQLTLPPPARTEASEAAPAVAEAPDLERRAESLFATRLVAAKRQLAERHYAKARDALVPFPEEFAQTKTAEIAERQAAEFDAAAAKEFDALVAKAKDAAARLRFDDARALIDSAAAVEAPWAAERAKTARASVDEMARESDKRRESQAAKFDELYGNALLAAGRDVAAARAWVDRAGPSLDTYSKEKAELLEDIAVIDKNGADADALEHDTTAGAWATLLALLSHGDVSRAKAAVEPIRSHQGDVAGAYARIARVEGVLRAKADALLAQAEERRAAGDLAKAIHPAEEACALLPDYVPARMLAGRIRFEQRDYTAARDVLDDVVLVRSAAPAAHLLYGRILASQDQDPVRAESELQRYLDAAPPGDAGRADAEALLRDVRTRRVDGELRIWRPIAKAALDNKRLNLAEGAYGRILEAVPDDPDALLRLAKIYDDSKRPQAAFVVVSRLLKGAPLPPDRKKQADAIFAKVKDQGATDTDGCEMTAEAQSYLAAEQWDRAITIARLALVVSPHLTVARITLIRALLARARERNSAADAKEAFDAAEAFLRLTDEKTWPAAATPLALRSDAQLLLGHPEEARNDAIRAVSIHRNSAAANVALGRALLAAGDAGKATEAFALADAHGPSPESLLGLARCFLLRSKLAEAENCLARYAERYADPRLWRDEVRDLQSRVAGCPEPPK